MATTKMWPIKGNISSAGMVISNVVDYVSNPEKTEKDRYVVMEAENTATRVVSNVINYSMKSSKTEEEKYITAINCSVSNAIDEMIVTKKQWAEKGKRLLWHGYQSFAPGEVTPEAAHNIGVKLAKELYGDRFEVVVATHLDRAHIHNHFVINSVSFIDGKKLDWDTYYPKMKLISDRLCKENELSLVENSEYSGHYHRGAVRAESDGRPTLESIMIEDVDCCIIKAASLNEFYGLMESKGYRIDNTGKYLKIYPPGRNRCIRLDRRMRDKYNNGEAYTIEGIERRILDPYKPQLTDEELNDYDIDISHGLNGDTFIISADQDEYFTRKGLRPGIEAKGIAAIHIKYMCVMGVYPQRTSGRIARTHYLLREDILKLDKYINESKMLIDNKIYTDQDLTYYKGEVVKDLKVLEKERNKIRNRIRRCKDEDKITEYKGEVKELNKTIKQIKKKLYYCNDIKKSQDEMKRKFELVYGSEPEMTSESILSAE